MRSLAVAVGAALIAACIVVDPVCGMEASGQQFTFFGTALSWEDAEKKCVEEGMHLASIHSKSQMNAITKYIVGEGYAVGSGKAVWIGLNDIDVESTCNSGKADTNGFGYPDGSFVDYLPLKEGGLDCCPNPNCNSAGDLPDAHDCVWIDWTDREGYKFKFNAPYCSNRRPFLCSGPPVPDAACGNLETGLYKCTGQRCSITTVFKCDSGSNCQFKKTWQVPEGTEAAIVSIHAVAEYHHGGDFSVWDVGGRSLRCDGGGKKGGVTGMCTEGRNCIVNERFAVSDSVIEMQKLHGYGGNFECDRHGGNAEFEFRITLESDGDIGTAAWTNICSTITSTVTTTTATSTTLTTTTIPECNAGYMLDVKANRCINCPEGQFQSHFAHQHGGCTEHRPCPAGSFVATAGTASTPNVCSSHSECDTTTQWESKEATDSADRECTELTVCQPGEEVGSGKPTPTSDRQCGACESEDFRWSDTTNQEKCFEHSTCALDERVEVKGTPTTDLECSPCPAGHYQDEAGLRSETCKQTTTATTTTYTATTTTETIVTWTTTTSETSTTTSSTATSTSISGTTETITTTTATTTSVTSATTTTTKPANEMFTLTPEGAVGKSKAIDVVVQALKGQLVACEAMYGSQYSGSVDKCATQRQYVETASDAFAAAASKEKASGGGGGGGVVIIVIIIAMLLAIAAGVAYKKRQGGGGGGGGGRGKKGGSAPSFENPMYASAPQESAPNAMEVSYDAPAAGGMDDTSGYADVPAAEATPSSGYMDISAGGGGGGGGGESFGGFDNGPVADTSGGYMDVQGGGDGDGDDYSDDDEEV